MGLAFPQGEWSWNELDGWGIKVFELDLRFLQEELTKQINERNISSVRMSTPPGQGFAMFTAASPVPRRCQSNIETAEIWLRFSHDVT